MTVDPRAQWNGFRNPDTFRLLVERIQDYGIFMLDPDGYIMSWNEGARRIKGYRDAEILGKHFSIFYPPPDVKCGKPGYELRVAADEGRWEEEGWRVRKDGSRFWASVDLTALRDDEGQLVGFAKVTCDLTERKQAEDQRERLLALERAARAETELTVERLRMIQSVTEAALAHLGLDDLLQELLGRIAEVLAVDTAAILLLEGDELVVRAAKGLEEAVERGIRIPIGRGFAGRIAAQRRPVIIDDVDHANVLNPVLREKRVRSLMGVPLPVHGQVIGVLHVGTLWSRRFTKEESDLLQLVGDRAAIAIDHVRLYEAEQRARAEAERAVRLRDEFLSVAAHELKTPVTTLRLATQALVRELDRSGSLDLNRARLLLERSDDRAANLSRLVDQLLDVSRLETGRLTLDRQSTDVAELVTKIVATVQLTTNHHTITVRAPSQVQAPVDPLRLEQVVTNLIDNAIKYSPKGGPIDLEVALPHPAMIQVAVRDRGVGIPPERRSQIFDRFHQAQAADPRAGLGLGLYISRQIVELHGGRLDVEFPDDGGTRFVVSLPTDLTASIKTAR